MLGDRVKVEPLFTCYTIVLSFKKEGLMKTRGFWIWKWNGISADWTVALRLGVHFCLPDKADRLD